MGQYYTPVNLNKKEYLYSHNYDNGLKLMEHSYIGNNFVGAVENLLVPGGTWYKNRIVWTGDYADEGKFIEDEEWKNKCPKDTLTNYVEATGTKIKPEKTRLDSKYKYVVNHSKEQFVDRTTMIRNTNNLRINPLPLLTCDGNGRGGGDYDGKDMQFVGAWAGDIISIEEDIPKGYTEIHPNFKEIY